MNQKRFNYTGSKIAANLCSAKIKGDSHHFWVGEAIELLKLDEYDFVEMYLGINPDTELSEDQIFEALEIFYAEDYCIICNENCTAEYGCGNFVDRYYHDYKLLRGWVCGFCAMEDQKLYQIEDEAGNDIYVNEDDFNDWIEKRLVK